MSIRGFQDLDVWNLAMDLGVECYNLTGTFPKDERFRLGDQILRSSSSVSANIAEGHGRNHTREYLHFLGIARGSLAESLSHLILSKRVGLISQEDLNRLEAMCERIGQMLTRLRQSLERRLNS